MKNIPAGYQLHITSWECDGDHYNTKTVSGLTREDVPCYLEVLSLFKSVSQGGFSNDQDVDRGAVMAAVLAVVEKHPDISERTRRIFTHFARPQYANDHLYERLSDLLGRSEHCDFRVFDSAKVYYYETPVMDVSKRFVRK